MYFLNILKMSRKNSLFKNFFGETMLKNLVKPLAKILEKYDYQLR
jgi:hypothetical protein